MSLVEISYASGEEFLPASYRSSRAGVIRSQVELVESAQRWRSENSRWVGRNGRVELERFVQSWAGPIKRFASARHDRATDHGAGTLLDDRATVALQ